MARRHDVKGGFRTVREAGDPARLPESGEQSVPAREQLVRVGLMPHVEHDPLLWRPEAAVQRDGQLRGAEIGRQMPAVFRDDGQNGFPQFVGENGKRFLGKSLDVLRTAEFREVFHCGSASFARLVNFVNRPIQPSRTRSREPWRFFAMMTSATDWSAVVSL